MSLHNSLAEALSAGETIRKIIIIHHLGTDRRMVNDTGGVWLPVQVPRVLVFSVSIQTHPPPIVSEYRFHHNLCQKAYMIYRNAFPLNSVSSPFPFRVLAVAKL
jgi:hypothetical protein